MYTFGFGSVSTGGQGSFTPPQKVIVEVENKSITLDVPTLYCEVVLETVIENTYSNSEVITDGL